MGRHVRGVPKTAPTLEGLEGVLKMVCQIYLKWERGLISRKKYLMHAHYENCGECERRERW